MKRNSISNPNEPTSNKTNGNQIATENIKLLNRKRKLFPVQVYTNHLFSRKSTEYTNTKTENRSNMSSSLEKLNTFSFLKENKGALDWKRDTIRNLSKNNERLFLLRQNYLLVHKELDTNKRRILLDWLMEVSNLFNFQRETYHGAIVLLDIYLSKINKVEIKEFQLIGITCLLIAAKNEEVIIPSITTFAQTTNFAYKSKDILCFEIKILNALNWKINHPNLGFWLNYLIAKWDMYTSQEEEMPKFKKDDSMYKYAFKVIDIIAFDYIHLSKEIHILPCVVLYLVIGLKLSCFTINEIRTLFLVNENNIEYYQEFNAILNEFLIQTIGIELINFGEHLSYVSSFFCCIDEKRDQQSNEFYLKNDNNSDSDLNSDSNDYKKTLRIQDYSQLKSLVCQIMEEKRIKSE